MIVCETFLELDGPRATEDSLSYAVRLLKENVVVLWVEDYLRINQRSRKCKNFPKNELLEIREFHMLEE